MLIFARRPASTPAGETIGALRKKQPDWFKEDLTELFNLLAKGKIKPSSRSV
jgi:hypothetical protein